MRRGSAGALNFVLMLQCNLAHTTARPSGYHRMRKGGKEGNSSRKITFPFTDLATTRASACFRDLSTSSASTSSASQRESAPPPSSPFAPFASEGGCETLRTREESVPRHSIFLTHSKTLFAGIARENTGWHARKANSWATTLHAHITLLLCYEE